jgi:hypothetical protein
LSEEFHSKPESNNLEEKEEDQKFSSWTKSVIRLESEWTEHLQETLQESNLHESHKNPFVQTGTSLRLL